MIKRISALLLICFVLLAGCSEPAAPKQEEVSSVASASQQAALFPYTFTDATGTSVTLAKEPQKVAVLLSSYAEIWQLAGGEVAITVGDSVKREFAPEGTPLVDSGAGLKIDAELLLSYEPDFVIASSDVGAQVDVVERLRTMDIPCASFREESLDDYLSMLKIFTDITGKTENYITYGTDVQNEANAIFKNARQHATEGEPLAVLFVRAGSGDSSTRAKTAENHFVGVMLDELGTTNIADKAGILSEGLSLESIVQNQPDIILIATQGDEQAAVAYMDSVLAQNGWKDLDAVASGKTYYLPKDLFQYKPNARWAEAYAYLDNILYAERGDE